MFSLILFFNSVDAQTYYYDAKSLGYRIEFEPSQDEILIKFRDTISEKAITKLVQNYGLDNTISVEHKNLLLMILSENYR